MDKVEPIIDKKLLLETFSSYLLGTEERKLQLAAEEQS